MVTVSAAVRTVEPKESWIIFVTQEDSVVGVVWEHLLESMIISSFSQLRN